MQFVEPELSTREGWREPPALQAYPLDGPFLNDDYRKDPSRPFEAYPENNRQAVKAALRSLQNKIRALEKERLEAEKNIQLLTSDTYQQLSDFTDYEKQKQTSDTLEPSTASISVIPDKSRCTISKGASEIHHKLDTAENRCHILEQQLENMHAMIENAEKSRRVAERYQKVPEFSDREPYTPWDTFSELEKEPIKLTPVRVQPEDTLELIQAKGNLKKKKKKVASCKCPSGKVSSQGKTGQSTKGSSSKSTRSTKSCGEQYQLNMADIPFLRGKAVTPSHHLAANFQEVLSLLKSHNPKLCYNLHHHFRDGPKYLSKIAGTAGLLSGTPEMTKNGHAAPRKKRAKSLPLTDVLLQLQDEFGQMSFEHQELAQQIREAGESRLREDLERELDHLVAKMQAKGEQITRLRNHQEMKQHQRKPRECKSAENAQGYKKPGKKGESLLAKVESTHKAQASLNLYKGLKIIQSTLKTDDVSWDY